MCLIIYVYCLYCGLCDMVDGLGFCIACRLDGVVLIVVVAVSYLVGYDCVGV